MDDKQEKGRVCFVFVSIIVGGDTGDFPPSYNIFDREEVIFMLASNSPDGNILTRFLTEKHLLVLVASLDLKNPEIFTFTPHLPVLSCTCCAPSLLTVYRNKMIS